MIDNRKTLPDLPSELIRLALGDLKKCEASPDYRIDMTHWHVPGKVSTDKCAVCFAGAVMAQTLSAALDVRAWPSDFAFLGEKLRALDRFRTGMVDSGLSKMGMNETLPPLRPESRDIPEYRIDTENFHAALEMLADAFAAAGL